MAGVTIGTIRNTEKGSILVLSNDVEILYKGEKVNINEKYKSLSLFNSEESARGLHTRGLTDDEGLAKKLGYIAEKKIVGDVVAFPVK